MYEAVELTRCLKSNIALLRARLNAPDNADVLLRRFRSGAFESALLAIDGMCDAKEIDEQILKPCMSLPADAAETTPEAERVHYLMEHAVSVLPMKYKTNVDEILSDALSGQCVLLCEGCETACVMDTRGFEKRTIGKPDAERVVLGPHESFGESIRTNITLLRRIVQREELVTEFISVGGKMKTRCALMYLRGSADEAALTRIRRRLLAIHYDYAMTTGEIEQFIEDHPLSLIPQCVRTERPDRAASFLAEGQIVILTDGSPAALGAPATLWHQLHTPDDTSMRWQYGTFLRMVRFLGIAIHVLLPGIYLALLRFHQELFSPMLLTSVYETGSRVPIPVFVETLLMTLAFDLISEAGLRAPGAMGNALGIVSGLILGQSAVSADIVSPLLLIVVAASGLGGFCVPGYALSIGLKIVQLIVLMAGAAGGLYLITLVLLALLCALCGMQSVVAPLTAPVTPPRPAHPDITVRLPLLLQSAFSRRGRGSCVSQRIHASWRICASASGLCVGAAVYALCTAAAVPLCLNAAWLAAFGALPACIGLGALSHHLLKKGGPGRAACVLIAAALLGCAAFSYGALISLVRESLLPLARISFIAQLSAVLLLLCCLAGHTGTLRFCFSLRWVLPLMLILLASRPLVRQGADGLFPLWGTGRMQTGLAALIMLPAGLPALLIALQSPPQDSSSLPGAWFLIRRLLVGACTAIALLALRAASSTYEAIAAQGSWGERMLLLGSSSPRSNLAGTLLLLFQTAAFALSTVLALQGAWKAAKTIWKGRKSS